jgi:hypothetical protein
MLSAIGYRLSAIGYPPNPETAMRASGAPTEGKLKVFISSKMAELRDVREIVDHALGSKGIQAFVYEAAAGARPDDVVTTSLAEVEAADVFVGLFWQKYGDVTGQEYLCAHKLGKPCFVYIRDKDLPREAQLERFLKAEVYDLQRGVTYDYFDSALKLGEQIADDIMRWLVQRHREMTAAIAQANVSQDEIARLQALVAQLQATSSAQLPHGTDADYLAQQMRAWFETLGYRFERYAVRERDYFEWLVEVPARRGYDRILVRGVTGVAELSDLEELRQAVEAQHADEGWLVTLRRVSPAARDEAGKQKNLFCYTFDELLDQSADFSGYLDWLEAEITRRAIDRMYIPLACTSEEFDPATKRKIGESRYDERDGWIDGYIDRWLDDPSKEHISILGEFGTGKSWFALHYAWTALQRYRDAMQRGVARPRLPLVIPLRDYAKAVSVESLFSEFFFRKYEIPLPGYSAFEQLNRMGKLLLIFDGFDEMAARVDRQQMINNFWELARVVVPGAKAILTCRTEHFPQAQEGRALLNAELRASTAALTGEPPQFEVLELAQFDDAQVRQLLALRTSPATVERIMGDPQLLDLARRPVMAELILEALPEIEAGKPVDMSRVYLYAVRRKLERDIKDERTFTSLADKLYFMCELSWEMLSTDQMSLNYRLFPDRLRRLFGPAVQEQKDLDHWHYDMMGQSMLIRNADGDYTPAHRSLLEFFVAYKFAAELGALADDFTDLARVQSYVDTSAPPQEYTWSEYFRREMDGKGSLKPIPPLHGFVAEDMSKLAENFGAQPLFDAVHGLMRRMLGPDEPAIKERLLATILATRGLGSAIGDYVGGNAATLLIRRDLAALRGCYLAETTLTSADFSSADLRDCDLRGAVLQMALFQDSILERADLRGADLAGSRFGEAIRIQSISFSPDGSRIASAGRDSHFHIWDMATGTELLTIGGHRHIVQDARWNPDGTLFASSGEDGTVRLWNGATFEATAQITSNEMHFDVAFAHDGSRLATSGSSGNVAIWDVIGTEPVELLRFKSGNPHSYSPIFYGDGTRCVCCGNNGVITIWDIARNAILTKQIIQASAEYLALSPDERILAAPSFTFVTARNANDLAGVWKRSYNISLRIPRFSPDGRLLFVSCVRGVLVLRAEDGAEIMMFRTEERCIGIDLSPDGTLLAAGSANSNIHFWDARPFVAANGEPRINIVEYTPPDLAALSDDPATWPEWWQGCKLDVPAGLLPNPDFGKLLRRIEQRMSCKGLRLAGAKGLDAEAPEGEGTLGEWLAARGAILEK